ncbi:MAG TPA: hypothetical protein VGF14_07360 [Alphaproteobacteria bacterium]
MAGFSFLSGVLPTALGVASTINRTQQQNKQYKAQKQQIETANRNQQEQIAIQADKDETARRDALRRAVSRQRAQMGAQGIDSSDGSAEAILLGLTQQSDLEQQQQDQLNSLRSQALQESANSQQRKNLLSLNQSYDDLRLSSLFND